MRPLIWVSKSMEKLAAALTEMGHPISADTVRKELVKLGFSRQSNRKADEGSKHPDRNAQFEYINAKVIAAQGQQQPDISVDTEKLGFAHIFIGSMAAATFRWPSGFLPI